MRTLRLALFAVLLAIPGCTLTLLSFLAPASVPPGSSFELLIVASPSGIPTQPGEAGAVLQLPIGFQVLGAANYYPFLPPNGGQVPMTRDDPSLLGLYTAEPGHYLASWSGVVASPQSASTRLKVIVQAPAVAGVGTIKLSLAGQPTTGQSFVATSPASLTNFAQITAASAATHVRTIAIDNNAPAPFFGDASGLTVGSGDWSGAAFADLDGDGNDDLIASPRAGGVGPRCWLRTGGTWNEPTPGPGALLPAVANGQVAVADFDGDGFRDLADSSGRVQFGNGGSAWALAAPFPPGTGGAVAAGDVNGDGIGDVAFAVGSGLQVHLGNSNRTFSSFGTAIPGPVNRAVLRDVTGDGFVDVVAANGGNVTVWSGNGLGSWTASNPISGGLANVVAVVDTGDLDGDGAVDLVVNQLVHRHLGNNQWAESPSSWQLPSSLNGQLASLAVLDFDRDGRMDVAAGFAIASPLVTGGIVLWRNQGNLSFAVVSSAGLTESTTGSIEDLAVGDINGDTFPDLAATVRGEGVFVWQNGLTGLSRFGSGCQGLLPQTPQVEGLGAPAVGNPNFALRLVGGQPSTIGLLWLGTSTRTWNGAPVLPQPIAGALGCTLWTGLEAPTAALFDANGALQLPVPIPPVPALRRLTVFAQGAAVSPGSNALGFAFTDGLAIRIQ